jgi:hypothetical protein
MAFLAMTHRAATAGKINLNKTEFLRFQLDLIWPDRELNPSKSDREISHTIQQ